MLTDYLLLTGSALNYLGAAQGLTRLLSGPQTSQSGQLVLQQTFISGVAATFGSLYTYLFFRPQYIVPFLPFGASLKYWAFLSALIAYQNHGLARPMFMRFGVGNALVGTLLWVAFAARYKARSV